MKSIILLFLHLCLLHCGLCMPYNQESKVKHVTEKAVCILKEKLRGKINLEQYDDGTIKITGFVSNLSPGEHGFHVHEYGDLTYGCVSTGGHYNPEKKVHGSSTNNIRHIGDLGNIIAGSSSWSEVYKIDKKVKLSGEHSVVGRAIVIHKLSDDLGKGGNPGSLKTGNAGARLGCCVIGYAK